MDAMSLMMEKAVVAALLCRPSSLLEVVDRLRPEMFSQPDLQFVYAAILSLHEKGVGIDMLTVESEMLKQNAEAYSRLNGLSFLSDMIESVRTDQHIRIHADEIIHYYALRFLNLKLQKIQMAIQQPDADEHRLLDELQNTINELHTETMHTDTVEQAGDVAGRLLAKSYAEQSARESGTSRHIFTGLKDLDQLTGGLYPGELTVLPARPSMGKTAVALWMALSIARQGHAVSFFSVEMSKEEVVGRLLSMISGVNTDRLRFKGTTPFDRTQLAQARDELSKLPVTIEYCGSDTVDDIRAKAHRLYRQGKLGILFIDYLNLINIIPSRKQLEDTTDLAMGNVARKIKLLAEELCIPIVLLAQMNRESDKRPAPHYPVLSDLRNSGAIEQVAAVRTASLLQSALFTVSQLTLSPAHDPDSQFRTDGSDSFHAYIREQTHNCRLEAYEKTLSLQLGKLLSDLELSLTVEERMEGLKEVMKWRKRLGRVTERLEYGVVSVYISK